MAVAAVSYDRAVVEFRVHGPNNLHAPAVDDVLVSSVDIQTNMMDHRTHCSAVVFDAVDNRHLEPVLGISRSLCIRVADRVA